MSLVLVSIDSSVGIELRLEKQNHRCWLVDCSHRSTKLFHQMELTTRNRCVSYSKKDIWRIHLHSRGFWLCYRAAGATRVRAYAIPRVAAQREGRLADTQEENGESV